MGRRAWPLLERRLRPARHLRQHLQRFHHRLFTNVAAADRAKATFLVSDAAVARGDRQMHEPNRLARRRAAGTCDARDRHCEIDIGMFQCAERHRGCGFLADCAESFQRRGLDAEHRVLGFVGIGDETAIDHIGRAGNFGECRSDETTRAGLGGRNRQLAHPAQIQQRAGKGADDTGAHADGPALRDSSQGRRIVAAAVAAIPS